jgi:PIN domain-containing protein
MPAGLFQASQSPRGAVPRGDMALRLCLDVNVWVSYYLAIARGRGVNTAASGLADAVFTGSCRLGPVQLIVSHAMLDTLAFVLRRMPVTEPFADMVRDQVEAEAGNGYLAQPPSIILGGTAANAILDREDAAVLNAAMAGRSDLFATHNIEDFIRGPRARTKTTALSERDGKPDVFRLDHPRLAGGLIVTSPFRAASWLLRGERPPPGVLPRLFPPDAAA